MKYIHSFKLHFMNKLMVLFMVIYSPVLWAQEYDATLMWSQKTGLGTVVSGIVEEVYVDAGDKIAKGKKMLQLDTLVSEARVTEFRAKLASAKEYLNEMERERDRALELYDRTVLSEHDLQMAKNSYINAKAKYEKVRAGLADQEYHLKYSVVRAPFNAIVLKRNAQPGQVIATQFKQDPLVVIASSDKMLAQLLVTEDELRRMEKGKTANISIGDKTFTGKIQAVGLELFTTKKGKTGYPVDVEFKVGNEALRSGLTAKVNIE